MSELEKSASELVNKLNEAIDFAFEQGATHAPDVIEQLLLYKTIQYSLLPLIASIFLGFFSWVFYMNTWGKWADIEDDGKILGVVGIVFSIAGLILSSINLIKILVAPKVYLLEYSAGLL